MYLMLQPSRNPHETTLTQQPSRNPRGNLIQPSPNPLRTLSEPSPNPTLNPTLTPHTTLTQLSPNHHHTLTLLYLFGRSSCCTCLGRRLSGWSQRMHRLPRD